MYTDGISEAHDTDNNQYTDERLLELVTQISTDDIKETGNKILENVDDFARGAEQFDDITLLMIHYE